MNFKVDKKFQPNSKTNRQLNFIEEILQVAQENNKFIFLKGGWNIDLSFGRPTRHHDDIDFHFDIKDIDFWKAWFKKHSFSVKKETDWYFVFSKGNIHIDFGGVEVSKDKLIWEQGNSSKISDVIEPATWRNVKYNKMKLGVEEYLKNKYAQNGHGLRKKDLHDLRIIKTIKNGG